MREEITGKIALLRELKIFENLITNVPNILTSFPEVRWWQNRIKTTETDDSQGESPTSFKKFINGCYFHHSLLQYGIPYCGFQRCSDSCSNPLELL